MARALVATAWIFMLGTATAQTGWVLRTPPVQPPARAWNLFAHDLARSRTVLFGGWSNFGDTWEWDGASWTQRMPANSPSARCCSAHAYDLVRSRIVLFGGYASSTNLSDTWEYDGTNWTQIPTATTPPIRRLAGMALDVVRGTMVMFGGGGTGGATPNVLGDMWEWNGATWTQLAPAHLPPARWSFGMTTDFGNARVLLHGGSSNWSSTVPTFTDTWSWDGTDWTQIVTAVQPPPIMSFGMTYDWMRNVPVLFGGEPLANETWLFAGNTWVRDVAPGPAAQAGCTLAFDVAAGRIVFFAGNGTTWEYITPPLATWLPFGPGCAGSAGVPLLRPVASSRPVVGAPFVLELVSVPTSGLAAISIGFSASSWSGGPLPAPLAPLGMPGCTLWVDPQFLFTTPVVAGRATLSWALPNVAAIAGTRFYDQAIVLDAGINPLGAVVSNAGTGLIGTL
jgi:hypothetical protein